MSFEDIYRAGSRLELASAEDVADAESALGTRLPRGYPEFLTTLGTGEINGWLRLYMPSKILNELEFFQSVMQDFFTWDRERSALSQARAAECIPMADTGWGDWIAFHPADPDTLFSLPRNDDAISRIGEGFEEALDWLCESGALAPALSFRYFEPTTMSGMWDLCAPAGTTDASSIAAGLAAMAPPDRTLVHPKYPHESVTFFYRQASAFVSLREDSFGDVIANLSFDRENKAPLVPRIVQHLLDRGFINTRDGLHLASARNHARIQYGPRSTGFDVQEGVTVLGRRQSRTWFFDDEASAQAWAEHLKRVLLDSGMAPHEVTLVTPGRKFA